MAPFVKIISENENGVVLLNIGGHPYQAGGMDHGIYDAIALAEHWPPEQRTFERVIHLRHWLRENEQHGHFIDFEDRTTLADCRRLVDEIIHAAFDDRAAADEENDYSGEREQALMENAALLGG